jgi:hypothetical protein
LNYGRKPGGFFVTWGLLAGGYAAASVLGVRVLQRFFQWGSAALGEEKEFVARFELEARRAAMAGLVHVELLNVYEARLWLVAVKLPRGWSLFFTVNLGARPTKASQQVLQRKAHERMLEQARREQAERIRAGRAAADIRRRRQGHPWPARAR